MPSDRRPPSCCATGDGTLPALRRARDCLESSSQGGQSEASTAHSSSPTSAHPVVRDQLALLTRSLGSRSGAHVRVLCGAAGDLFQLAGELAFDQNRLLDAAAAYTLAASASKEAEAFDLWACALTRHAYGDLHEGREREAAAVLSAAERVARRGDSALSTRHWVAAVKAEAFWHGRFCCVRTRS